MKVNQNITQSTLWNKEPQSSCILFRESTIVQK